MKKGIKKIFSLVLALVLSVVMLLPGEAKASEVEIEPRGYYTAEMSVYSNGSGHAWITIRNCTDNVLTVGHLDVSAGDTISIGTFGNRANHKGIWYNIEAYYNSGASSVSKSVYLTLDQFNTVNSKINSSNQWTATNNCSKFAVNVWNSAGLTQLSAGSVATPQNLYNSIVASGVYSMNRSFATKGEDEIYRHTSEGVVQDSTGKYGGASSSRSGYYEGL